MNETLRFYPKIERKNKRGRRNGESQVHLFSLFTPKGQRPGEYSGAYELKVSVMHIHYTSVFGSVNGSAFQKTFRVKMHANNIFLFFKNYF
jgi:hypothetical protein